MKDTIYLNQRDLQKLVNGESVLEGEHYINPPRGGLNQ